MRAVVLLCLVAGAAATKELTPKDFDKEVLDSGKGAFIKFLAPWWGHCKSLKPDWDKLANTFKGSDSVGIFDVDCTSGGEPLCQKYGVKGYPTIKYWLAGKKSGIDYQQGRDFNSLKGFVERTFKPACDPLTAKGCNEQEKRYLEKVKDKTAEELTTEQTDKEKELKDLKKEKADAEKEFNDKVKKWKSKEVALTKAVTILKTIAKDKKKSGGKDKTAEL